MGSRRLADFVPGQHPRQLDLAVLTLELENLRHGPIIDLNLVDLEMGVCRGRDLGQVGDGEDLIGSGEIGKKGRQGRRRRSTETRVDLVEEQGHGATRACRAKDGSNREVDPRELTPRGDPRHRSRLLAGVGGDQKLALLDPIRVEGDSLTVSHQRTPVINPGLPPELQTGSRHVEPDEHILHRASELGSSPVSSRIESLAGLGKILEGGGLHASGGREPVFDRLEPVLLGDQRLSLIHISEPTRPTATSRMPSWA